MSSLGCPECGRTPVIYLLSTKIWTCKSCRHSWREADGKTEPVYFVADLTEPRRRELLEKSVRAQDRKPPVKKAGVKVNLRATAKKTAGVKSRAVRKTAAKVATGKRPATKAGKKKGRG